MAKIKLSKDFIRNTVKRALNEDLYPSGDITSNLVKNNKIIKVKLLSNENAIVGGLLFAKQACFANNKPPTIAFSFDRSLTLIILLFFTKFEVISPEG